MEELLNRGIKDVKDIHKANRVAVLRVLYDGSPLSRSDLVERTRLSPPTITRIVKDLMSEKLVIEAGKVESARGRNPALLQLNFEKVCFVGVDINRLKTDDYKLRLDGVVSNLKGEAKAYFSERLSENDVGEVAKALERLIEKAIFDANINRRNVFGVGVSISGVVSSDRKEVVQSDNTRWSGVHVDQLFPAFRHVPVLVENDANASVLGERWLGGVNEASTVLFVTAGDGIGASIFHHGNILRGVHGVAGEIGHLTVVHDGKLCPICGNRGCLETYVDLGAIQQEYNEMIASLDGHDAPITDIIHAFRMGNDHARKLVFRAAEMLGQAILNCILLLDPEEVIIGGRWVEAGEEFLIVVRKLISDYFPLNSSLIPKITFSNLYPHAGVMGAIGLIIDDFLIGGLLR